MQNRKVLIVNEDRKLMRDLEHIVVQGGYVTISVADPRKVVSAIVKVEPDVVLMELEPAGYNIFELADAIKRMVNIKPVPIVVMSAFLMAEFEWLLRSCGIKRCIKKPFQPLDLIWAIENEIQEISYGRSIAQEMASIA